MKAHLFVFLSQVIKIMIMNTFEFSSPIDSKEKNEVKDAEIESIGEDPREIGDRFLEEKKLEIEDRISSELGIQNVGLVVEKFVSVFLVYAGFKLGEVSFSSPESISFLGQDIDVHNISQNKILFFATIISGLSMAIMNKKNKRAEVE